MWIHFSKADMEGNTSMDFAMGLNNTTQAGNLTTGEEEPSCNLFLFLLYVVAMGIMCLFGFAGNTVSFMVLHKDRSTPVASFLLKSLAMADNIFLFLWVIMYSVKYTLKFFELPDTIEWIYIRVYSFPVLYMAQTMTIWLTVVISLNRFMAVCLPYKAPHLCNIHNVYKEVAVVTIFSILYNIPRFFELEITRNSTANEVAWNRTYLGKNNTYRKVYTDGMYYLFSFILPLLILAFVNTRVIIAYQATQKRKRRMSSRRADNENNITLVMIMVVVIFMLCQAPARVVQFVTAYSFNHCLEPKFYLIHISNTLEVLNSSVNFLIYCIFHKRFRDILYSSYCCGPIAEWGRRDSARFTTTEGLSLEEAAATMSASRKSNSKTSSSKNSSSRDQSRNGSLRSGNMATAVIAHNSPTQNTDMQKLHHQHKDVEANGSATGDDGIALQPLRVKDKDDCNNSQHRVPETVAEEDTIEDDASKPLTPANG